MSPSPFASSCGIAIKSILFLTMFFLILGGFCVCVCENINHAKGRTGYFTDMEMKK